MGGNSLRGGAQSTNQLELGLFERDELSPKDRASGIDDDGRGQLSPEVFILAVPSQVAHPPKNLTRELLREIKFVGLYVVIDRDQVHLVTTTP